MTLPQFRSLSPDLQRRAVQQKAVFLLGRTGVHVSSKLYQVDGFYVELYFDAKSSALVRLASFAETGELESYLQQVDIGEVQALLR